MVGNPTTERSAHILVLNKLLLYDHPLTSPVAYASTLPGEAETAAVDYIMISQSENWKKRKLLLPIP